MINRVDARTPLEESRGAVSLSAWTMNVSIGVPLHYLVDFQFDLSLWQDSGNKLS
jgi:hypothetical protein